MKCFKHPQSEAVGTCKHCSKGVCTACAVESGFGLACSPECKDEVLTLKAIMERNKKAYPIAARACLRNGVFLTLMAFAFFAFGLAEGDDVTLSRFLLGFGVIMLVGSVFAFLNGRKWAKVLRA